MNIEILKKGSTDNGDCGNDPKTPPDWMDLERFRRGQQFFQRHIAVATFALHCSLTVGFGVSNLVQPLAFTKKSDTAPKALRRYLKTFVHVVLWHTENVWDEKTQGHRSTQVVRKMHNTVRKNLTSQIQGKSHLTQYDMAIVQAGFMAAIVTYPSNFGIKCTKEELEDYVFFWRGIGYLLGIKDEFNICSRNYDETYRLCKQIEYEIVYRGLLEPPAEFETLSNAYINGVNLLSRFRLFSRESVIAFALDHMGLSLPSLKLSWGDKLRVQIFRLYTVLIRWTPGFERTLNFFHFIAFRKTLCLVEKEFLNGVGTCLHNS